MKYDADTVLYVVVWVRCRRKFWWQVLEIIYGKKQCFLTDVLFAF